MIACPKCRAQYDDSASFCLRDGTPLNGGSAELSSDDCPTSITDTPEDLEPVLELEGDLNAVALPDDENGPTLSANEDEDSPPTVNDEDAVESFSLQRKEEGLPPGTMVGQYRIESKIAEGGMGVVYAAIQPLIGKRVAVKLLHPRFARDQVLVDRFIQEARAVNTIGHPNIVDIFAIDKLANGSHYFVMELLEGEDLAKHIKRKQRFSLNDALPILLQIAQALATAHEKGVVHRDLKPDNVYLLPGKPPKVKLLDFGVAKLLDDSNSKKTNAGGLIGTPFYMSTEQCNGGEITGQSDLYSLAVLTYEMLAGAVPFRGNYLEVITAHLQKAPPALPPEVQLGAASDAINSLLQRAMSKKPSERPAGVTAFVEELERLALEAGLYTPPLALSGGNFASISSSLQLAMQIQSGSFPIVNVPDGERSRKITTLTGATGEVAQGGQNPLTSTAQMRAVVPVEPPKKRSVAPLVYGGSALLAISAVAAVVLMGRSEPAPAPAAPPPPPPPKVAVQLQTEPAGGDLFDKDNFLLGRAPATIDPSKEATVTVRWGGRFPTTLTLTGQSGPLVAKPTIPADPAQEPLLSQLIDPKLGLQVAVMSTLHDSHKEAKCEGCHASEMVLDASLCQGCHNESGPGAKAANALDNKQCGACHTPEFKAPPRAKFHLPLR